MKALFVDAVAASYPQLQRAIGVMELDDYVEKSASSAVVAPKTEVLSQRADF